MQKLTLAYLAGAMDSDGCFGIKRSTYHMRVRKDATNPTFSERLLFKQVTPQVPELLSQVFGGTVRQEKPSCMKNGRPLHSWTITDKKAAAACRQLLPYLRVKRRQCELLLELRKTKDDSRYRQFAYWYEKQNPDWRKEPMLTRTEVTAILNYKDVIMVTQATRHHSLLALPWNHVGKAVPRFPERMVFAYRDFAALSSDNRGRVRPPELIAWRERLHEEIRQLNKMGVNGTTIYHRTGYHTPAAV